MTDYKIESPATKYSKEVYAKAKKYQKIYGFELGKGEYDTWNNESDAFKHTFGATDMALKTTPGISKHLGDRHEKDGNLKNGQTKGEDNMDKWNNSQGRQIANEIKSKYDAKTRNSMIRSGKMDDVIASKVMNKMKKGELITKPSDTRKYKETYQEKYKNRLDKAHKDVRKRYGKTLKSNNKPKDSKGAKGKGSGATGTWVTINGAHVFLD